jgi:hypothetical protein
LRFVSESAILSGMITVKFDDPRRGQGSLEVAYPSEKSVPVVGDVITVPGDDRGTLNKGGEWEVVGRRHELSAPSEDILDESLQALCTVEKIHCIVRNIDMN